MKKFTIIYEELDHMKLGKPQMMYPAYMNYFGWESEVITYNLKKDLPEEHKKVKIKQIKQLFSFLPNENITKFIKRIPLYIKIYKEAKKIDVLMLYHLTKCSYWNAFFYKLSNPNGLIFIKGDFEYSIFQNEVKWLTKNPKTIKEFFKKRKWKNEFKKRKKLAETIDIYSVEAENAYEGLLKNGYAGVDVSNKLLHIPNGFDLKSLEKLNIQRKSYEEKENIIFTACRLGTEQKNTEFFLEVLNNVDLKNWKVVLAGPVEEEFKETINKFYKENPQHKERVKFLGYVTDKALLYSYHNKAKIFMMTSRWESFANVFLEAMYFGEHIVVSRVSGAEDLTNHQMSGKIIEQKDLEGYSKYIQEVIDGKIDLEDKYDKTIKHSDNFLWEKSVGKLRDRIKLLMKER
ncbi:MULTISPECIES: glycosyltransferase family 4 protein [Psychrilyobacter]|uniref:Glycosyltransferase n=1 Tax=Psychrilyobacter piezotolerans TaxID=2293438 RepID=A0ABX9KH49_9FUSO|nr:MULTISPECIES: glycosyltransferase [Psychrilyobacter]MCS5422316.1 glycosyltransferase [Psychrilyobacter sp. S5]NDI77951.1 glycosyltransferase [Psychrilyobacter piezotolerans]RDE62066.1 glycosyltransferase [Psychrilyobacter sp. S5]REI41313.1 glycosyltransferase [Psychrilyobacter piezotolerans]